MFRAELELEAITPIFMRGADQTKAEIRAPSIKGLMRWWFRALAGNYFGNEIDKLRKAEENVFGSTNQRSKVVIEVNVDDEYNLKPIVAEYEIMYDRRRNSLRTKAESIKIHIKNNTEGEAEFNLPNYLFFSIKMLIDDVAKNCLENILSKYGIRNRFNNEGQMKAILRRKGLKYPEDLKNKFQSEFNQNVLTYYPAGTKFHVKIEALDEKSFKIALASFWALVTLGGIGFRSHRGAGSIEVKRIVEVHPERLKNEVLMLFSYNWRQIEDATQFWDGLFKQLCDQFHVVKNSVKTNIFKYPSIKELIVLECSKRFNKYIDALLTLEEAYAGEPKGSGKRSRYEGGVRFKFADKIFSHTVIEQFKRNSRLEKNTTERRFYFGLPLIYANWRTEVSGYNESNPRDPFKRRSSSFILTVKKDRRKFIPIVVIIPYQFLPNHKGKFIAIKRRRKTEFQLLTDNNWFVEWLKNDIVKEFEERGFVKVHPKG